jgi:hypothetical protein
MNLGYWCSGSIAPRSADSNESFDQGSGVGSIPTYPPKIMANEAVEANALKRVAHVGR